MLVFTQKRVNFHLEVNELLLWIAAKEAILSVKDEYQDFDHVEMLQKKFDDFQKVINFFNNFLLDRSSDFYMILFFTL